MNLPNQLTLGRLVLAFVFTAILSIPDFPYAGTCALVVFVVAAITDALDGYLARKHDLVTNFGKLMDPLADKVLMAAGFIMLIIMGHMPAWMVVVILAREFLVTGLRLIASAEGTVIAADNLGKFKTISQIVAVIYFLVFEATAEAALSWFAPAFDSTITSPDTLGVVLVWAALVLTIISGAGYVLRNRELLK